MKAFQFHFKRQPREVTFQLSLVGLQALPDFGLEIPLHVAVTFSTSCLNLTSPESQPELQASLKEVGTRCSLLEQDWSGRNLYRSRWSFKIRTIKTAALLWDQRLRALRHSRDGVGYKQKRNFWGVFKYICSSAVSNFKYQKMLVC